MYYFFNLVSRRFETSVSEYFSHFFLQTPAIIYISEQYAIFSVFDKKIEVPNTFRQYKLSASGGCSATFTPDMTGGWREECKRKREAKDIA